MQLNVNVEVTLSGARVELTKEQTARVSDFVHGLFNTKAVKGEKRAYVRKNKKRAWTPEEVDAIREAMKLPLGKPRNRAYKAIAMQYKRTRGAVTQKAVEIRAKMPYQPITSLPGFLG